MNVNFVTINGLLLRKNGDGIFIMHTLTCRNQENGDGGIGDKSLFNNSLVRATAFNTTSMRTRIETLNSHSNIGF